MSISFAGALAELYAAPTDVSRWASALDAVSSYCDCGGVTLFFGRNQLAPGIFVSTSLLEGNRIYLSENWYQQDVVAHRTINIFASGERAMVTHLDLLRPGERETLPIYRDFYPRVGLGKLLSISLTGASTRVVSLGLHRALTAPDFDEATIERALRFAPHIQTALNLTLELADRELAASSLLELCDALEKGVVVLDRMGVAQVANRHLSVLLGEKAISNHRFLTGHSPTDTAIATALATLNEGAMSPFPSLIPADGNRPALVVQLIPAPADLSGSNYYDLALTVMISPLRVGLKIDPVVLAHRFNMTPGEARLASEVGSGKTTAEAAEALGISPATAKLVLHRVYKKAGVTRLPSLLGVLAELEGTQ